MKTIRRNPDVLWREESPQAAAPPVAEDAVAGILFADGEMVSLNELGMEIWKLCDGRSEDAIVAQLLAEFEVPEEVVRQDVTSFLADLASRGFVRYE